MCSLLGEPSRLKIMLTCLVREESVNFIKQKTVLSQPLVIHHLRGLKTAQLIRGRKEGRRVLYSVSNKLLVYILRDMINRVIKESQHG